MQLIMPVLLVVIFILAAAVTVTKKLLPAVIIFMFYGLVMSAIWLLLESPDLAITEASVGAGISSILFFVTLRRLKEIDPEKNDGQDVPGGSGGASGKGGDSA